MATQWLRQVVQVRYDVDVGVVESDGLEGDMCVEQGLAVVVDLVRHARLEKLQTCLRRELKNCFIFSPCASLNTCSSRERKAHVVPDSCLVGASRVVDSPNHGTTVFLSVPAPYGVSFGRGW